MANLRFSPQFMQAVSGFDTSVLEGDPKDPRMGGGGAAGLLTRSLGTAVGRDMRTRKEKLTAALAEIDPTAPNAEQQQLTILAKLSEEPMQQIAATQKLRELEAKKQATSQKEQTLQGSRSITAYINQLSTEELLSQGSRAAISELERTFNLPAGQGASLIKNELEIRKSAKIESTKYPEDYQKYLLAVPEGQRATVPYGKWTDRNQGGTGSSTELERAYASAKASGAIAAGMSIADYKNTHWSPSTATTLTGEQRLYKQAQDSGYSGTIVEFLQDVLGKGKTPELKTFPDKNNFRIYATGPNAGEYVNPKAKEKFDEIESQKLANTKSFIDKTVAALTKSNIPGIQAYIPGVKSGGVAPEEALALMQVPSDLIPAMNELVNEGSEARGVIKQDVNLLADYNANVPPVGTPASQLKKAQEWWTGGDDATLVKYNLEAKRVDTTNFRLPPGAASDVDVERAESTVPPANASPSVVRSWLLGQMKIKALMAAEAEAKAEYMMVNAGSLVGFNDEWAGKSQTVEQIQAIYSKFGVPPTGNYTRKVVQADKDLN